MLITNLKNIFFTSAMTQFFLIILLYNIAAVSAVSFFFFCHSNLYYECFFN